MENEPCRWTSVQRDNLVGGSLWGLNGRPLTSVPLKSGSPLSALGSLCYAWKSRASLKLGLLQKACSHNIWPSWTFNQHLVKSLKKPSKAWSYAKELRALSNTEQQATTEGHPQSDVTRQRHAGFPTSGKRKTDQRHFNLKASNQTTFILLNRGVSISKVKLREFSIWWSTRVKSCGNRTVLDCNHSQLNSLPVRVCMYVFCLMLFSLVHVL